MPDIGSTVNVCVEVLELGEPKLDARGRVLDPGADLPIIGKTKIEGHAHVVRQNEDGSIDVAIYDNKPTPDNHSAIVCGASNLKQGKPGTVGAWWVQ